jgi:hypothetical protein
VKSRKIKVASLLACNIRSRMDGFDALGDSLLHLGRMSRSAAGGLLAFDFVGESFQFPVQAVGNVPTLFGIRQVESFAVNAIVRVFEAGRIPIGPVLMFCKYSMNTIIKPVLPFEESKREENAGLPAGIQSREPFVLHWPGTAPRPVTPVCPVVVFAARGPLRIFLAYHDLRSC